MVVPRFDFNGQRDLLEQWAERKGKQGLLDFWEGSNQEASMADPRRSSPKTSEPGQGQITQ